MPAVEDKSTVKKEKYVSLFWPIVRGVCLIVALWSFIAGLSVFLHGEKLGTVLPAVFLLASYGVVTMPPKSLRDWVLRLLAYPGFASWANKAAIEREGTEKARQHRLPDWPIVAYCFTVGLGCNWACAFLWFSRRYSLFSGPVVGATGLIIVLYAAIALLLGLVTGGKWRTALLVFLVAPGTLGVIVLRLGLLR